MGESPYDHIRELIAEEESIDEMNQRAKARELSEREHVEVGLAKKWAKQKSRHN